MKHSDNILKKLFSLSGIADMLVWLVPILMCVPNVALSIVEPGYTPAERSSAMGHLYSSDVMERT